MPEHRCSKFTHVLTLLHSEQPKLHRILAVLSAIGLMIPIFHMLRLIPYLENLVISDGFDDNSSPIMCIYKTIKSQSHSLLVTYCNRHANNVIISRTYTAHMVKDLDIGTVIHTTNVWVFFLRLTYRISLIIRWSFFLLKQAQRSRPVL